MKAAATRLAPRGRHARKHPGTLLPPHVAERPEAAARTGLEGVAAPDTAEHATGQQGGPAAAEQVRQAPARRPVRGLAHRDGPGARV